ncbi:aldo/keto reductase [Pseudoalteromonas shioyasakiensis]|uniref:aldo/keto reductase n=1 Tax=Pseudoalteromonas shioyasakiensis TaxID=1190813 RepID=UPI0020949E27|nr:aldo/keto reductase [Pseudoalteromonas shioyasakiensis]MCO6354231.1 aldo/keto reductase [Pseudoalteromonas shioyasakiensis]
MKLALGTVQFGLNYGVTNTQGQVLQSEVNSILDLAKQANIKLLDTASAYGESESALGKYSGLVDFNLVTKIPKMEQESRTIAQIAKQSLSKMHHQPLHAILFHDANDLLSPNADYFFSQALKLKNDGICKKIGVSVYTPEQMFAITERYPIELVQIPFNCFDQRFAEKACQNIYKRYNIEVHARSLFLQGTLLCKQYDLPSYFTQFKPAYDNFHELCEALNCQPMTLALAAPQQLEFIDHAILGVCSALQLKQILQNYSASQQLAKLSTEQLKKLQFEDLRLINPANWSIE